MSGHAITAADVRAAAERIRPHVHLTPVLRCASVDDHAGAEVHLKAEHLQRSGSFKARGAHNALLQLSDDERRRGVVAVSSGNHATAVACAGRTLGIAVDVIMPEDAPPMKLRSAAGYGARIHRFDRHRDDRAQLLAAHVDRHGSVPIEPFDDPRVMAGQGTTALELLEQADVDTLVVPMSGGGLMAGCAVAARDLRPDLRIVGVEPAGADDTARSFAAGERVRIDRPDTVADGLAITQPGALTFPITHDLVDEVVTVTDDEILDACVVLLERAKQVVEPSGAASVAAVLARRTGGRRIGVVVSGGNVDLPGLAALCGERTVETAREER